MITKMLLGAAYWGGGFLLAVLGSIALGFALCALVGLFNIFRYKWAWGLMLGYATACLICLLLIQGVLYLTGTLGDHTGYKMQVMILVGLAFPGVIMLAVIPAFIKV